MDELQKLYDVLVREGKYTKSFDDFKSKWSSDNSYKNKVYEVVSRDGLYTKDRNSFIQKYSSVDQPVSLKKKDEPISTESGIGLKASQPPAKKTGKFTYNPESFSQSIKALQDYSRGKTKDIQDFADPRLNQIWVQSKQKASQAGTDPVGDFAVAAIETASDLIPKRIKNSWESGKIQGELAGIIGTTPDQLTPEQISEIAGLERQASMLEQSEEAKKFDQDGFSWMFKNPVQGAKFLGEVLASSLSARLYSSKRLMPAGVATGAVAGSVVPGVGTLAGAATGLSSSFITSSLNLETSQKILQSLRDAGFDTMDEESIKKGLMDKDMIEKARVAGLKRGVPIMLMDAVSTGLGSRILLGGGSKLAKTAATSAVGSGTGALGEFLAQVSAGEQIRPKDIALEAVAELGSAAPGILAETVSQKISRNKTSASNENIAKSIAIDPKEGAKDALRNLDQQLNDGRITEDEYNEGIEFVAKSEKAAGKVPVELNDDVRAKSIVLVDEKDDLVSQIADLEKQKEGIDDAFHKPIDNQISEKVKQLDSINKQIQDAVQKQTAGEIPVQPEARVGEEVAKGEPQAEPQEVAKAEEEVDVERQKAFVLMDKVDADIRKREGVGPETKSRSLDKRLYESTTNALQQTSWYQQADDTARENAIRELASKYGVKIKRAPSIEKATAKKPKMILIDEYKELKKKIKMKDIAVREGIKIGEEMSKEKQQAMDDITQGLRDEIKIQLDQAKETVFKGKDISGTVAQRIMKKINNAKTPLQLLSAVDYLQKSIDDIDYTNKVDESKSIASRVKRLASNAPLNIKQAISSLANSNPKESGDLAEFNDKMSKAYEFLRQKNYSEGINESEINSLAEKISKNNLKNKIDDAVDLLARKSVKPSDISAIEKSREEQLKSAESKEQEKEINRIYDQQIEDLVNAQKSRIEKPVSDSIKDMQKSLDEYNDLLRTLAGEAVVSELGGTGVKNREALEAINDILRNELEDVDVNELTEKQQDLVEALQNIDIERLTDKQLKFLNYSINNFIENGRFDGVGQYIYNEYKIQRNFNKETVDLLKSKVLAMNEFKRASFTRTSVDTFLNSIFANEKFVAKFRDITGLGKWSNDYGSKNGFRGRIKKDLEQIREVAERTKIIDSRESQIKIGAIADILQHESGLTDDEIQAEFLGRKEAMAESVNRGLDAIDKNSENYVKVWAKDNKDYVETMASVYDKYIKDAKTPEELKAKLTKGEKELWEAMRGKWESIKEKQRELSEINKNEAFDDLENYHARTYIRLYEANVDSRENLGFMSLANSAAFRVREKIDRTKSTAFKDRVLKGAQVRENHILNYNVLDSFQNEYRKQLYDYFTFEDRQYVLQVLSSRDIRKALNNDLEVLKYVQNSYSNRYSNEVTGLQAGRETGLFGEFMNVVRSSVVRDALGGFINPFVKQIAPSTASAWVNAPKEWISAIHNAVTNSEDYNRLLSQAPVSMRHTQEVAMNGGMITAKDIKKMSGVAKKALRGFNDISDKVLMGTLKVGDQSTAGWNWLAYYQKSLLDRGKIKSLEEFDLSKEADSPDQEAIQYAEQMTSTTLNINEAVNKPLDQTIPFIGKHIPFTSFAMNSYINMLNNIGKIAESNGVMSIDEKLAAARRIGSRIAESYAINKVGQIMRYSAIAGSYSLFKFAVEQSDMKEDEKNKAYEILENTLSDQIESNDKNSQKYFYNDLAFGQIGENFFGPIAGSVYDGVINFNRVIDGKQQESPEYSNPAYQLSQTAALFGYPGIYIAKFAKLLENTNNLITYNNDESFRLNKFGYVNAYGNKVIPFEKQTTTVPAFNKYMQTVSVLSNITSLASGTPNEIQNFTRRIPQINKRLIIGLYGKDSKVISEKERYAGLEPVLIDGDKYYLNDEFSVVSDGVYDYILNADQVKERKKFKDAYLDKTYNDMMKMGVKAYTDLRKNFETLAKKDPNNKIYKQVLEDYKYAGKFQDRNILMIANEVSKAEILSKYIKNGVVKLKLKDEIKKK